MAVDFRSLRLHRWSSRLILFIVHHSEFIIPNKNPLRSSAWRRHSRMRGWKPEWATS